MPRDLAESRERRYVRGPNLFSVLLQWSMHITMYLASYREVTVTRRRMYSLLVTLILPRTARLFRVAAFDEAVCRQVV